MSESTLCAHPPCSCPAPAGKKYCSQMCEDSAGVASIKCDCKHPECNS